MENGQRKSRKKNYEDKKEDKKLSIIMADDNVTKMTKFLSFK